jgi:MYXO-CTERM domain-containing protein
MWKLFAAGIALALAVMIANYAVHLLNRSSDAAVATGYVILLALFSLGGGFVARRRRQGR